MKDKVKLIFIKEENEFCEKILSKIITAYFSIDNIKYDNTHPFFITGSCAFFGVDYVINNGHSDIDIIINNHDFTNIIYNMIKTYGEDYKCIYDLYIKYFMKKIKDYYNAFTVNSGYDSEVLLKTKNFYYIDSNIVYNFIMCSKVEFFNEWKFATICMKNLCKDRHMELIMEKSKEERIYFFKDLRRLYSKFLNKE